MNSQNTFQFKHFQPRPLELIDTTLREGSHTSLLHDHYKYFFNQNDKMEIARALILYGVKFIELFAPIVSPQEREDFAAIKAVRDELIMQQGYTFLLAHVRRTRVLLADLSTNYPDLILRFSGEDAFRTPEENIFRVYDELLPYVHRFGTPDSVGVATPAGVAQRLRALRQRYPDVDFEGHFHDDRGFALANTLAAVQNGMRYVQTTLLGVGERSGITSMTALLFNLFIDKAYDHLKGYHLRDSYPINVMFASKLKKLVPSKEPVSLTNRTHTAGVHQKAMLAHTATYEAFPLDQFGVNESEVLLGPLSGWNIVHYFLKEIKYYNLDEGTARQIAAVFKERIYNLGPQDSPAEILLDIAENEFGLSRTAVPERFKDNIVQRLDVDEPADAHGISEAEGDPEARREAAISLKH
jgi:homocitrate synthase